MSWHEFIDMGGRGAYVWSAYGVALVVLVANLLAPALQRRRLLRELARRLKRSRNPQ